MSSDFIPGRGLDVGTSNLISAAKSKDGNIVIGRMRDAFIDISNESFVKNTIKMTGALTIEKDNELYVIGEEAINFANLLKREARRPLSKGIISPEELNTSGEILTAMVRSLLGKPVVSGEQVFYSVPANPVDDKSVNNIYHEKVFYNIIQGLGFNPVPMNEALAICYSELKDTNFTGISISIGAGMFNFCLSYMTMPLLQFSIQLGGDWIDTNSGKAVSSTATRIQAIKEKGVNLNSSSFATKEEEAIAFYYQAMISKSLDLMLLEMKKVQAEIPDSIPIVLAGGTTMAPGFVDLFIKTFNEYKSKFPFKVSDIKLAKEPLTAIARGLLVGALLES